MLEPHTATFPHGSFSRKNRAAVAFQNLDSSIKKHPWFTPHKTHTYTPSFLSLIYLQSFPLSPIPYILISFHPLSFAFYCSCFSFFQRVCPPFPPLFCPSSILLSQSLQPQATSARLSATDLLIGSSLSSKHSIGLGGRLSGTDRLVLNLRH